MSFITELKRRNVFRVGIAYAVTTWLLFALVKALKAANDAQFNKDINVAA